MSITYQQLMVQPERFWNRVASGTSDRLGMTSLALIQLAVSHLKSSDKVLDLGCGWGTLTNEIAKDVHHVQGIDPAERMIDLAKLNAEKQAIDNVSYRQTNIFDPQLQSGSFDAVLAFNVLHYIEELPDTIQRIQDLLKNGGMLITSTACLKEKWSFARMLLFLLSGLRIIPSTSFYRKSDLEKIITAGGFELIQTKEITPLPEYFIVAKLRK